jgi:hypothetical protein
MSLADIARHVIGSQFTGAMMIQIRVDDVADDWITCFASHAKGPYDAI